MATVGASEPRTSPTVTVSVDARTEASFVASSTPRLSWIVSLWPGWLQSSVEITDGRETVTIDGPDSVLVPWPFSPLRPGEWREVAVRATSRAGERTGWSPRIVVRAGFLADGEWIAEPVGLASPERDAQPCMVVTDFVVGDELASATLFWTALGVAEPEVNGRAVSEDVLAPGWSSYRDRLVHETVDITSMVTVGVNSLSATIAGAWFTEQYIFLGRAERVFGDQPSFLAQVRLSYADGRTETVAATGKGWRASGDGTVVDSGIYAGEHQDLRRTRPTWAPARTGGGVFSNGAPLPVPEARIAPPVRRVQTITPVDSFLSPSGQQIFDFGQNLVGRVRLRLRGVSGERIRVRHAEQLEGAELALRPLRTARAEAIFDLAGGEAIVEPRFTFYGFRYAQVEGAVLANGDVEAVVLHTDMPRTGWFETSHRLLDRFHENAVWTMRGNFLAVPTDCPQRDERLGWTGDAQLFVPSATSLYDCRTFFVSWLRDLGYEQERLNGRLPLVVPSVLPMIAQVTPAGWGDAATVIPSVVHERFGDRGVLEDQYRSMVSWVEAVLSEIGDSGLWAGHRQLGDWLDPSAPPDKPWLARTDGDVVATAYLSHSLRLVAHAAEVLERSGEAKRYWVLAERTRQAFEREYVTPAGRVMNDTATAYALALVFDLVVDPPQRERLAARLAEVVREDGYRITTGIIGTALIGDALTESGYAEVAGRLLLQTEFPSWLHPVTLGATTIWERWDSMLPDGSVNPGEMTSFNHYTLGSVVDWIHRDIGGLGIAQPGYRRMRIAPHFIEGLNDAATTHDTPYGRAEVRWRRDGGDVVVNATVPSNSCADVHLPAFEGTVDAGVHSWRFRAPSPPLRPPLAGVDASLAEVVEDERAHRALVRALDDLSPALSAALGRDTRWTTNRSLRSVLLPVPSSVVREIDEDIRRATAVTEDDMHEMRNA